MTHEMDQQCWRKVVNEGIDCLEMIRQGYDCHCSCSNQYRMYTLFEEQDERPAFHYGLKIGERDISIEYSVWAGAEFR